MAHSDSAPDNSKAYTLGTYLRPQSFGTKEEVCPLSSLRNRAAPNSTSCLGLGLARTSYARLPVALPRCAGSCYPVLHMSFAKETKNLVLIFNKKDPAGVIDASRIFFVPDIQNAVPVGSLTLEDSVEYFAQPLPETFAFVLYFRQDTQNGYPVFPGHSFRQFFSRRCFPVKEQL